MTKEGYSTKEFTEGSQKYERIYNPLTKDFKHKHYLTS